MIVSDEELQESLLISLVPTSQQAKIAIPKTITSYVMSFNEIPTIAKDGTKFDPSFLEKLGRILTTVVVTDACAVGIPNKPCEDVPRVSIAGAILSLFFTIIKYHMGSVYAFLDELQKEINIIKTDCCNSESFLKLCMEMLCHIHLIRNVANACDIESSQFSKILEIPPVKPDMDKFCEDLRTLISLADSIRIGYLEKQTVTLNEENFSQLTQSLRNTLAKYIKIFDTLFQTVRKVFVSSFAEKPLKIYQNYMVVVTHFIGLFVLVFIDCLPLNPNKSMELSDDLLKLSRTTFDLISSSNKIMRFRCDFIQEKNKLRDSYNALENLLNPIKSLLYDNLILDKKVSKVFADYIFSSDFNVFSTMYSGFVKKIDMMITCVKNDKKFMLFEPLSVNFIASPVTQNGEYLLKSLNNMLNIIENQSSTKKQLKSSFSLVLTEYEKFQNYLNAIIQQLEKTNEKRRILHLKDNLTIAINEFRLLFEEYINNHKKTYLKKIIDLLFNNLMLAFCSFDSNIIYLSNLKSIVLNQNGMLKNFWKIHFEELKNVLNDFDKCNFSQIQPSSKSSLIKYIFEVLNKVPDSPVESFNNLYTLHLLLTCLFAMVLNSENEDFIKSEQSCIVYSYLIYIFNFMKIFKKSVQIYLLRNSEIFLSLGTSCLLLLKQLMNYKSNDCQEKIKPLLPETAKTLKSFESKVAEMRYNITLDSTEFYNILESVKPLFPVINKILDEIKGFTDIPYLANVLEKDIFNMKEVIDSFQVFDEFIPYFQNTKLNIPNHVYSGPLMINFLREINQDITQFLQLLKSNCKNTISLAGLEISQRLSDCLVYIQLTNISSNSYQILNSNYMHFAHSSAGIAIAESKEQQKIIPIIESIIKECNNLLRNSCQISNEFDKMILLNGNVSNAKLYSNSIIYFTTIFTCDKISKYLISNDTITLVQKKPDDISNEKMENSEKEDEILFKKEEKLNENNDIENFTNNKKDYESINENSPLNELENNIVQISKNFPPPSNELDTPFKFVDNLICIPDDNENFASEISNFDDIPKYILTPPKELNHISQFAFPNLVMKYEDFSSNSSFFSIGTEKIKRVSSFHENEIDCQLPKCDDVKQSPESIKIDETKTQNYSFNKNTKIQESNQSNKSNSEQKNDDTINLPNPLKSNNFDQFSSPSDSDFQSEVLSTDYPPPITTNEISHFSFSSDFEQNKTNKLPIPPPFKKKEVSQFSLPDLEKQEEQQGDFPPPITSNPSSDFSSVHETESKNDISIKSSSTHNDISQFSFQSESNDNFPPPISSNELTNYSSDSDSNYLPPPIRSNKISQFSLPSDSNPSSLEQNIFPPPPFLSNHKSDNFSSNNSIDSYSSIHSKRIADNMLSNCSDSYSNEPVSYFSNKLIPPFRQSPRTSPHMSPNTSKQPLYQSSNKISSDLPQEIDSLGFTFQGQ